MSESRILKKESNLKFFPAFVIYEPDNTVNAYLNEQLAIKHFNSISEGTFWKRTDEGTHFLETFIEQKLSLFQ